MPTHTELKGVSSVFDALLSDALETNLLSFFQWGFLGVGGFLNAEIPQSGAYGGDESRLRLVDDPNYEAGQVWEGFRKDWVWETGVPYVTQPIRVSGVYVDGDFQGLSGVSVDYPNGRVIFDSPVSTSSTVTAEYSYRLFQLYSADSQWWQAQPNSFRVDDPHFLQAGSGSWDVLAENRVQFPAIVVEAVPKISFGSRKGLELGNLTQVTRQDVLFHVLTEDRFYLKWLHDAITAQVEKSIIGFDKNRMLIDGVYPLNPDGSINPSGLMYPDLVKPSAEGGYGWRKITIEDAQSTDQPRMGNLHYCTVRLRVSVDAP